MSKNLENSKTFYSCLLWLWKRFTPNVTDKIKHIIHLPWYLYIRKVILILWRTIFWSMRCRHWQNHHYRFRIITPFHLFKITYTCCCYYICEIIFFIIIAMSFYSSIYVYGIIVITAILYQSMPVIPANRNFRSIIVV